MSNRCFNIHISFVFIDDISGVEDQVDNLENTGINWFNSIMCIHNIYLIILALIKTVKSCENVVLHFTLHSCLPLQ